MMKLPLVLMSALITGELSAAEFQLTIHADPPGISPDLLGVFFEDINYAVDGGLYAELSQNRSFEYQATEQPNWTPMTAWEVINREGAHGSVKIAAVPI